MNVAAFILALAAGLVFLAAWFGAGTRRPLLPLGLALLTAAWIVQSVWAGTTVHVGR